MLQSFKSLFQKTLASSVFISHFEIPFFFPREFFYIALNICVVVTVTFATTNRKIPFIPFYIPFTSLYYYSSTPPTRFVLLFNLSLSIFYFIF
jgi:hypothetical protein